MHVSGSQFFLMAMLNPILDMQKSQARTMACQLERPEESLLILIPGINCTKLVRKRCVSSDFLLCYGEPSLLLGSLTGRKPDVEKDERLGQKLILFILVSHMNRSVFLPQPLTQPTTTIRPLTSHQLHYPIDMGLFIALQEAIQPDWFEALCDGDTPQGCSVKRTRKAVDRTLTLLDACLEAQQKSEILRQSDLLGVIEGGQIVAERQRSAKETALRPVAGFVVDGVIDQEMDTSTKSEIIQAVLKELPESKPRLLPGISNPCDVLEAVEAGIDIFDSSYPYKVTQRGCALVFPLHGLPDSPAIVDAESIDSNQTQQVTVTGNGQQVNTSGEGQEENGQIDPRFELDLSDSRFAEDFSPVFPGCDCYCCTHHTKAYINHLLNVNELLARVLLMTHNCHHYFEFFHSIRTSLKERTFQNLKETISSR
ncbi:queuine tRNA-ribosyltransferase accessory subunit 2-like isoform X3 [Lytechinus pictus]|uniref:queuine tRNA-ribosyltransferase accessory subunit 2-like isoform X3 n=1 Tax=Lytechinus pictus TaxID=7653 RepID=UPI0030BA175C